MPSKKRRRSDDGDGGDGGGDGGRQVVLGVPRTGRTGHHHYDTNDIRTTGIIPMPSKKRRRSDDGGGDGGRQVVLGVPRTGRTGHQHYDTNDIVTESGKKRYKHAHHNCNNTDNSIVQSVARESPRVNTMPPESEAINGINDGANVIGNDGDNNFSGGGNKLASTCIMSSVPNIDQNTNTNTTHGTQGGEGGEGGLCPTTILQTLGENHATDGVVPAPSAFNEYYPQYSQQFEVYSKFFERLTGQPAIPTPVPLPMDLPSDSEYNSWTNAFFCIIIHRRQSRHMF